MNKIISKIVNKVVSSVSQTSVDPSMIIPPDDKIIAKCREAATEGMVLLKNNDVLPLPENAKVAIFGRTQFDTFYVGYGSGGDVNAHHKISFFDGLKNETCFEINKSVTDTYLKWRKKNMPDDGFWGHWPMAYEEMIISDDIVHSAATESDYAIIFIGRAAGEDRENTLTPGSYYLTKTEEDMINKITSVFTKVIVVLNIGGIFDFSWVTKYNISSILIAWQGGMETGNACADIISGKVSPSGCLPDTIADKYESYPSSINFGNKSKNIYQEDIYVGYRYFETFCKNNVLFPFGHGLSYSSFEIQNSKFVTEGNEFKYTCSVTNIGKCKAKRTVQLYCKQPMGKLGNPELILCAFSKTKELAPSESEQLTFKFTKYDISSYDDSGITGNKNCYLTEKGMYEFFAGFSVRDIFKIGEYYSESDEVTSKLSEQSAPPDTDNFMRFKPFVSNGKTYLSKEPSPTKTISLKEKITNNLPETFNINVGNNYTLDDVKNGTITINDFISTLNYVELEAISRGDYIMNSPLGPKGNAGVFGGVTESLRNKGIRPVTTTDGPSGIRLAATASLLPSGTSLASTWNPILIEELYSLTADEMIARNSDVLLCPGMNIHRNPLCGRNFEYYSEDPMLTGLCASGAVKGLQSKGVSACPKHFACNNQETNRIHNDSVVSERALRQIYLKGFEICVKSSDPWNIMTSYNKINGVWGHYNYELVTGILRNEWNYKGNVMTDWWMRSAVSPEFDTVKDQAYRVRAGVDVLMPGGNRTGKKIPDGTLLKNLDYKNSITTGELQSTAKHVCEMILKLNSKEKEE